MHELSVFVEKKRLYLFGNLLRSQVFESLYVWQGKRYSLANSRIMIHQPLGGAQGQAADIEIQANEILHHKLTLNGYLAEFTNQGMERITQDTGQSTALTAHCVLPLPSHCPTAPCCLHLQTHWLSTWGIVSVRKYALCSYAFAIIWSIIDCCCSTCGATPGQLMLDRMFMLFTPRPAMIS
jgi:hypothetical protein